MILKFFLSRNLRIARERAYEQTIISRGKRSDFWGPYVEEWEHLPHVKKSDGLEHFLGSSFGRAAVNGLFVTYECSLCSLISVCRSGTHPISSCTASRYGYFVGAARIGHRSRSPSARKRSILSFVGFPHRTPNFTLHCGYILSFSISRQSV